jgi:hypothetical protein
MGEVWIPEAEDLKAVGTSGTMDGIGGPRATAHVTVSKPGSFDDMHRVLTGKSSEPHVLYDMAGDRLGQYFGLDRSSRALMGGQGTSTGISHNKRGTVNIQVEICWDPTVGDLTAHSLWAQPRPNWEAFLRAVRSWGVADRFIFRTALTAADRATVERSVATWLGDAGGGCWWGHCHYDELESHWDPGPLNEARFFGTEQDMALTADDIKKLWNADVVPTRWSSTDDATNPTWGVAGFFGYLGQWVLQGRDAATANGKALGALNSALAAVAADAHAGRIAAEQALATAQQVAAAVKALDAQHGTEITAAVEAGLHNIIAGATTLLETDQPAQPVGTAQKGPLKAGLTDDGTV